MESEGEPNSLASALPALDASEMELYQHFLLDDMPEEDDGDEDFEPPVDEEEEGEEAGIRRRNIQSRELNDLLHDAYKQLGPSVISPGLRERVLDQLSMHFQLLVQTSVFAAKASPGCFKQGNASLGMLEHLACGLDNSNTQAPRTRASGKTSSMWWESVDEGRTAASIPGLLPSGTLAKDTKNCGRSSYPRGSSQQAVEELMSLRGAVVWPQLLPGKMVDSATWDSKQEKGSSSKWGEQSVQAQPASQEDTSEGMGGIDSSALDSPAGVSKAPAPLEVSAFSMVEDRLLCRGIHLYNVDWATIKDNILPHKSVEALMHRYAVLSGWASIHDASRAEPVSQVGCGMPVPPSTLPWTEEEDLTLRSAVHQFGKKWAHIARKVIPNRGRASLRSRWTLLEGKMAVAEAERSLLRQRNAEAGGDGRTMPNLMDVGTMPKLMPGDQRTMDARTMPSLRPRDQRTMDVRTRPHLMPGDQRAMDVRTVSNVRPADQRTMDVRTLPNLMPKDQRTMVLGPLDVGVHGASGVTNPQHTVTSTASIGGQVQLNGQTSLLNRGPLEGDTAEPGKNTGVEGDIDGSHETTGMGAMLQESRTSDRCAFAEDELSDDDSDGQQSDTGGETQNVPSDARTIDCREAISNGAGGLQDRLSSREISSTERRELYEEDELSDSDH
ncbi:unnamed protein product [Laminaria digitata]